MMDLKWVQLNCLPNAETIWKSGNTSAKRIMFARFRAEYPCPNSATNFVLTACKIFWPYSARFSLSTSVRTRLPMDQ